MENKLALEQISKGADALDRLATTFEKIYEESRERVKQQPTPPLCPWCGDINPSINVDSISHSGPILEFGITARCNKCYKDFYVIFSGWAICKNKQEVQINAQLIMEELGVRVSSS
jgi:hypothetical protein